MAAQYTRRRTLTLLGFLILLLGAWVFFVPLVGGYFNFGFASDVTWQFTGRQWELQLAPGIMAMLAGVMLMTPARGWRWAGALLAFVAGAWLVVGWAFYPVWASDELTPTGSELMRGVRWLGHLIGPGALILFLVGATLGLLSRRRTAVEPIPMEPQPQREPEPEPELGPEPEPEPELEPEPTAETRVTTPG